MSMKVDLAEAENEFGSLHNDPKLLRSSLTVDDRPSYYMGMPQIIEIDDVSDPRIQSYCDLKRKRRHPLLEEFIVEGRLLVERLLASNLGTVSILCEPRMLDHFVALKPEVPIYVLKPSLIQGLAGFPFHRGVMACGRRPPTHRWHTTFGPSPQPQLWCGLPSVSDDANLGSIIRSAHSFQLSGVMTSPNSADPFSRRSIRASMGSCFEMPIHSEDFGLSALRTLQKQGLHLVGVTRHETAIPLPHFSFPSRTMVIPGNEFDGIPPEILEACDSLIEIPMTRAFDSLNVGVAAAIVFYQWSISRSPRQTATTATK